MRTDLGLGHDIRAGLMDPTDPQLHALKALVCHLLAIHHREVIAYGAWWTDQDRQQPVGDTTRHEPGHIDAIIETVELQRALADPNPLRGIAQLVARLAAAYTLDPDGTTRTKALGSERLARRLRDTLPAWATTPSAPRSGSSCARCSPTPVARNRDAFLTDTTLETTVDLDAHHAESPLDDLELGDDT